MEINKIYLIGIGGIGMSALARYYNTCGYYVAGYDKTKSKLTENLSDEGIYITYTDSIDTIPSQIKDSINNTLIIYTPAIPKESIQFNFFVDKKYNLIKRSKALGFIAQSKTTLAVAGTHGKTTTSTILAYIFNYSSKKATSFLGGISKNFNSNLVVDNGEYLVAEADEYDRSFLQLYPYIAAITSTDSDHLDIYKDSKSMISSFCDFVSQIKPDGAVILHLDTDPTLKEYAKSKIYTYSYNREADFYGKNHTKDGDGYILFDLAYPQGIIERCKLGIGGEINTENAIAAAAIAILAGIDHLQIKEALSSFKGVERRFDIRVNNRQIVYIDDYAHHPSELKAAISSIKDLFPNRKLTGIFQPHLYSRTKDFYIEFAKALDTLDNAILLDIYPAREEPIEGVSSQLILDNMRNTNAFIISKEELMNYIKTNSFDVLITFGAGDIDRFVPMIENYLLTK